ncbi:hypothetical protein [Pseudoalteromonas sp. RB2-MNA-CIBAN-0110]|uniref:hypothetical protein n=1 Tax=Pseudoalteromonas sp. RB2-MNA-CIBAN-0110 TaxID=3140439 RepID=UPI00332C0E0C
MDKSKRIRLLKFFGERDVLASIKFWFIVFLLFIVHFIFMILSSNINYIGSFGAVLTVFGLLASFTHSLYPNFNEDLKEPFQNFNGLYVLTYHAHTSFSIDRSLTQLPISKNEATALNTQYNDIIINKYTSLINTYILTIIGTFIWAYAGYFEFIPISW